MKPAAPPVPTAANDPGAGGTPAATPSDRLSPKELCAYGSGIIAYQYPHYGLAQLAMPLFNVTLGVAPAQVGAVLMAGRIWDATLNPLVGTWSDNTRSRWGRRRPWLVAGAVLSGLTYPLVWLAPRGWSGDALSVWLLVSCLLLYTAFAAYSVPYMALGLELTPDTRERTRVQAWRTWFNLLPIFTAGWFYWFCQRPIFGDALTGARWLGLIVGIVIIGTGIIPGIFLRERYYRVAESAGREPFWPAAFAALRNRPFLLVMGIIVTLSIGQQTTEALQFYVFAYHVYAGDTVAAAKLVGLSALVTMLAAFLAIPLVRAAEQRWGKLGALRGCLWVYLAIALGKWWLATPAYPWLSLLIGVFTQFGTIGFWMIVNSMKADVCDDDELASGRRREGIYGAIGNLLSKIAGSSVFLLAGLVLQLIGFDAVRGSQDPVTIVWLRVAYSGGPILFLVLCLLLLDRYPLDERAMDATRRTLEQRRAAV
jgi:glycoside/pentoside/hexuronide:cation symporter, GPH family